MVVTLATFISWDDEVRQFAIKSDVEKTFERITKGQSSELDKIIEDCQKLLLNSWDVNYLKKMFPNVGLNYICSILFGCQGNVELAKNLLLEQETAKAN